MKRQSTPLPHSRADEGALRTPRYQVGRATHPVSSARLPVRAIRSQTCHGAGTRMLSIHTSKRKLTGIATTRAFNVTFADVMADFIK